MKKSLLFLILQSTCTLLPAQVINWAFNTTSQPDRVQLTTDAASNLYLYGSTDRYSPSELDGSVLMKYSPSGERLLNIHWKGEFFISRMINDGKGHFYFCGNFSGDLRPQGISLKSYGGTDGFIGKMDDNGTILWTIGFGGARTDMANDIVFNPDSSEIVITGAVDSTVYLYDYDLITTAPAIFVARFDLGGGLLGYKTLVYTPKEYGENRGLEIELNGNGGYYLLADRKGDHWSNEAPSGSPMEGRHIFDLDADLNPVWSRFIISSSCYYGYSCEGLSVQGNKACIPSFCSGKYGGTGRLQKLDAMTGATTFSVVNQDGNYNDTYAAQNNKLYYVGNEEANGCPCEDNNPGFARVKVLDELDADKILLSKYAFHFYKIVKAPNGNIYVFGHADGADPHLENHMLARGYFLFSMQETPNVVKIGESASESIVTFPNPSSDYVEVVHGNLIEELIVINGNGAVIRQAYPNAKAYTIRDLLPGYYVVRVKDAGGYRSGKVLVLD